LPSLPGSSGNGALANVAFDRTLRDNVPSYASVVGRTGTDSQVQSIFGGTTEIMKEIIGRSLDL
jgi:alkylation response protein AidB-like acyl-CoA dehydrogenase